MNILMMTNTFTPHVGGVARSVEAFSAEFRRRGHRVLVVAPEFENMAEDERDVVRIPAIQRFNGSDFSVVLPTPGFLNSTVERFRPDVVHSHHPFLIGGMALRLAHVHRIPLVFTHHTMYEQYTHYVPGDSKALKRFVINLSTSYANLCSYVIAPSQSVAEILRSRGVTVPIEVVPTGVELERFAGGSGAGFRAAANIPEEAFVVGHVGRLAPEKNLAFLAEAVAAFLKSEPRAHFLVVGAGPARGSILGSLARSGLAERVHFLGVLEGPLLISAYRAVDVFAFASMSETQGMVLTEAMAAGVPVVALDAPGVREIVIDGENGRLLEHQSTDDFAAALREIAGASREGMERLRRAARVTAEAFSMKRSADKALAIYRKLQRQRYARRDAVYNKWRAAGRLIGAEWNLLRGITKAAEVKSRAVKADGKPLWRPDGG